VGRIHSRSHGSAGIRDGCEGLRANGAKRRLHGRRTADRLASPLKSALRCSRRLGAAAALYRMRRWGCRLRRSAAMSPTQPQAAECYGTGGRNCDCGASADEGATHTGGVPVGSGPADLITGSSSGMFSGARRMLTAAGAGFPAPYVFAGFGVCGRAPRVATFRVRAACLGSVDARPGGCWVAAV
jgi:hypothetical protein